MRAIALLIVLVALSASGCASGTEAGVNAKPTTTKLKKAYDKCDPTSPAIKLGDGNRSILISGAGAEDIDDVACIVVGLNTPEYIVSEIDNTTALMGRQHEDAGGITYEWSYHPD